MEEHQQSQKNEFPNSDPQEYLKSMRFSQLDDEQAAKLYEDRFRQIQSDMMKKIQQKKHQQKKLFANPRSSSSLGAYGAQQMLMSPQNQQQQQSNMGSPNGQYSTKNYSQRNQIMSKFAGAATQTGFMYQSTTLNGGSRLPTEDNSNSETQQPVMYNFVPQKHKLKTQRSCEFIVTSDAHQVKPHQLHVRSVEDEDLNQLNHVFPSSVQNKSQASNKYSQKVDIQQNTPGQQGINSYQKQTKGFTSAAVASNQSQLQQRPFLSPPSKRNQQHHPSLKLATANNTQQGVSRFEMSPSGRASTNIMTSQGFYSPQANMHHHNSTHIKFTYSSAASTNRRSLNEADQPQQSQPQQQQPSKKVPEKKKNEGQLLGTANLVASKHLNGSQTTTAAASNAIQVPGQTNTSTIQFSNYQHLQSNTSANSPSNNFLQVPNVKSSVGYSGGINVSQASQVSSNSAATKSQQSSTTVTTSTQGKNNANFTKKKESTTSTIANSKRSELEELDLRIQTIEREIERDNEIAQQQQQQQNKKQNIQIGTPATTKNSYKPTNKQLYQNSPSHHISTDQGPTPPPNNSTNRHGLYEKVSPSTTTHKASTNLYQSPKQVYMSTDSAQQRKSQIYTTDATETTPVNMKNAAQTQQIWQQQPAQQSTKNQNKTEQNFNRLQAPQQQQQQQQENNGMSYDTSSYNNTPRSVNPIHDFRPYNKQSKKQVNFKSDNYMRTQESQEERIFKYSPTIQPYPSNDLKNQNQQLNINSANSRRNQQNHSNPPSQTRILSNTNTNNNPQSTGNNSNNNTNQGSSHSLKFQKKLLQNAFQNSQQQQQQQLQQQYSQNSNSNLQYQNSQEGTDEGDPEMSEFEYLEKIVNAKNTETSSVSAEQGDTSISNEPHYQLQSGYQNNSKRQQQQTKVQPKKQQNTFIPNNKKDNSKVTPIKGQQASRNQPNSNRESTSSQYQQQQPQSSQQQQQQHSISVEASPVQFQLSSIRQNKGGSSYLSLRQSDIIPSNSGQYRLDSPHIQAFHPSTTTSKSTMQKLKLKTLENNFVNSRETKDNADQYSKYSNNSNNAHNSSSISQSQSPSPVPVYNLYNQQNNNNYVPSSASSQKSTNYKNLEKQIQKKMNRSQETLNKNVNNSNNTNNNNNSNISNTNNVNQNTNITRTPSVSSNNISTISVTPQIQGSGSAASLNKGQLQMSNKQKSNPPIMMTHTLDTLKNKNDFKIKNSEQVSKFINQDPIHSSVIRAEPPKKSNIKQARFDEPKEEQQLEQMSKNLHKKLNLLLETANQCNENMKSYRISHNV